MRREPLLMLDVVERLLFTMKIPGSLSAAAVHKSVGAHQHIAVSEDGDGTRPLPFNASAAPTVMLGVDPLPPPRRSQEG